MNVDYGAVLKAIRPGAEWVLVGSAYSGLDWRDDSPKPTKATLDAAWPQVKYDLEVAAIKAERHARYTVETDPLFFKAQRGEDGVTVEDWKAAVAAIQAELPYPVLEA